MKKILALFCVIMLIFALCACGKKDGDDPSASATSGNHHGATVTVSDTGMLQYFNQMEYTLYQNIFYDDTQETGDGYVGTTVEKEGTFTVVRDQFNEIDRYYVWGFLDTTLCCDYQWEFVPKDPASLPAPGSAVVVTATFQKDDAALDGYWLADADVTVVRDYAGPDYDYDTTAMSATLARVQVLNMEYYPDYFDGKTLLLYGRALSVSSIQHPYYDGAWSMDFQADQTPATGTYLLLGGKVVSTGATCILDVTSYAEE